MANTAGIIDIKLRAGFDKGAMNNATKEVGKNMALMSNNIKKSGAAFNQVLGSTVVPFAAALVGAFALGGAAAVRFEEQFASVKKTLDIKQTGAEAEAAFANIATQLRTLAKFSPAGIDELTQIAAVGGQLGIAASDIVKFTDTIQKLTVATNMSAEDAAMSLARLQKITGLASSEVDNLASVIVKLGNNFATTESEIVTAATQIATATAGIKTEFNNAATDAVAFATALRAVGQPAQAGSTAIIRLVQVVDRLVDVGGPRLAEVARVASMTTSAFKDLFQIDPGIALASFIEGLGVIEEDGQDAVAVLEEIGLGQIRTRRALQALSRAEGSEGGGLLSEALAMSNKEFKENNALATEAERRYETVVSQIKVLKNIVNESAITFGNQFLPAINNVVQAFGNFLTAITQFDKVKDRLIGVGLSISALSASTLGVRAAFKGLTAGTIEYAHALSLARTGVSSLAAEEQKLLFTKQGRASDLLFRSGLFGGMTRQQGTGKILGQSSRLRTQSSDILGGGAGVGMYGMDLEVIEKTTLAQRTFAKGTIDASRAVKILAKEQGVSRAAFLFQNKAFRDSGLFLDNLSDKINAYNRSGKGTIRVTGQMQGAFTGLALSMRAVSVAFVQLTKSLAVIAAIGLVFSKFFEIIERIGARKRSLDEFANGLDGITESVMELESQKVTLEGLFDLKATKEAEDASKDVTTAIENMISQTQQTIASTEANIAGASGGILETLLYGQKGGKDLEEDIGEFAKENGLSKEALEKKLFAGLSGIVTDIQTGELPTINQLVSELVSGGTGNTSVDEGIQSLEKAGKLFEVLQSKTKNTLLEIIGDDLGIKDSDIEGIVGTLETYERLVEASTGKKIGEFVSGQEIAQTAKILEAKGEFLNQQQELLKTQGLLTDNQIVDARKQENYAKAVGLVMDTIKDKTGETSDELNSFEETLDSIEDQFESLGKIIDQNLDNSISNAITSLNRLPEAARTTAILFSRNFKENLENAKIFQSLVRDISVNTPLLAKTLSDIGPEAMNAASGLLSNPVLAQGLESQLADVVGPELAAQAAKMRSQAEQSAEDFASGFVVGLENKKEEISEVFAESVEGAIEKVLKENDMRSPSQKTRKLIGHPLMDGIIMGFHDRQSEIARTMVQVIAEGIEGAQKDFGLFTSYKDAQRGITQAASSRLQAEQNLNSERRNAASLQDRIIANQKELNKLEIEGAAGNITLNEEINILRKKISLEDQLKKAGGNKSANELLAIQKAEENISDLRAMGAKGVISNLELEAAEENLASLKGTDVSDDERKLMILELAQAEKDLADIKQKALEADPQLISLRETDIKLRDEQKNSAVNLKIAEDALAVAKEGVVDADLALQRSTTALSEEIANDSEYLTRLGNLDNTYSELGLGIDKVVTSQNILAETLDLTTPHILDSINTINTGIGGMLKTIGMYFGTMFGVEGYENAMFGTGEYQGFFGTRPQTESPTTTDTVEEVEPISPFERTRRELELFGKYGMGGRVSKYKYGGRGDPMTRALVGEYGPEEVTFVPGNGFLVKPLGTGKSGTVVNNLNVNVTGVPSDPLSARKAAVQISKALRKLDKEGSSGTGLRRN